MESSRPDGRGPPRHARVGSADDRRRIATPRSTKGPLDDPLAGDPLSPPSSTSTPTPTQRQPPRQDAADASVTSPLSPDSSSRHSIDTPAIDFGHLLRPENFHPLPSADVPPAFLTPTFQPVPGTPLPTLLSQGHYRAAAITAALTLTTTVSRTDHHRIFSLLHARLASLTLLDRHGLAAQEAKLLSELSSAFYRHPLSGAPLVPWELRVLAVRLQALGHADWRRGIMAYYELARDARDGVARARARLRASDGDRQEDGAQLELWTARLRDLGVRVASALVETGDLEGAARHLATLGDARTEVGRWREALLWLSVGDVGAARRCLGAEGVEDGSRRMRLLDALVLMADGDFEGAVAAWTALRGDEGAEMEEEASAQSDEAENAHATDDDAMIAQNLAVALLYTGRVKEARLILEQLVDTGPAFYALTFNLATIYELCSERARDLKLALAERVAARGPSLEAGERSVADFKL